MEITSLSSGSAQPKPNCIADLPNSEDFHSSIMELDTDGDGQISDAEFASYRSQKQAHGQFIPQSGPSNNAAIPVHETMQQAMFDALLARDDEKV